ncbi:MAG: AAA family ATPase [Candidatus Obscuribacterales bacterium]|nr:AAA family ATPase [Candidatus Obscuribacterales bacterium]
MTNNTSAVELRARALAVLAEYNKYVYGYEHIGAGLLIASISGGICHILAEGVPGLAKTHSVKTMAHCISDMSFVRVQFTPDMMPKEITGTKVIDLESRQSHIDWGPIFGKNFVLADEINRGKTNVQSALLEPMAEGQGTVAGSTRKVENPFVVMATQNPIEQEGTNPLPEAQHDRFLFKFIYDYASLEDELKILENPALANLDYTTIKPQMSKDELLAARDYVANNINVSRTFNEYLLKVCRATRPGSDEFKELCSRAPEVAEILNLVKVGVSPRALQGLQRACKVNAFLFGKTKSGESRDYVMPSDLKGSDDTLKLAHAVLRHRIIMKEEANYRKGGKISSEQVIDAVLSHIFPIDDESAYSKR